MLFSDQQKYTKTITLDRKLNIAMTRTLPGSKVFRVYIASHPEPCDNVHDFETHIIPDRRSIPEENDNISFHSTGSIEYTHEPEQNDNLQESEKNDDHLCIDTANEEQTMVIDQGSMMQDFHWRFQM